MGRANGTCSGCGKSHEVGADKLVRSHEAPWSPKDGPVSLICHGSWAKPVEVQMYEGTMPLPWAGTTHDVLWNTSWRVEDETLRARRGA